MKLALVTTTAAALCLGLAGSAMADEVIIHRDAPVVEPAPTSSTTTEEKHTSSDGCASKTVHQENDVGDSKTVHTENCD